MEKYCISVDWLQTFCHAAPIVEGKYSIRDFIFEVKKENHETAQFKDVFTVTYKKHLAATIQQTPRTSVINPRATCVKLSNRLLYCERYIEVLYAIQEALNMTYKGITRLDICYDCNRLFDGRNVERFIRQYVSAEAGEVGHIIRNGSSRFQLHGVKSPSSSIKLNSIRWGSPRSKIGAYCYNKTIELLEVKDKPWIREMWAQNGLVSEVDEQGLRRLSPRKRAKKIDDDGLSEYAERSVWRFEISIKSQGMDVLNMSTAELFKLSPRYLEHAPHIARLFHIYAGKVFDFRINTGQKQIRHYHKMTLFENAPVITSKPFYWSSAADTGRMEKICYNKLQKLAREYVDLAEPRRLGLLSAMEFLLELQGKKSQTVALNRYTQYLNSLYATKFIDYDDMMYFGAMEHAAETKRNICAETVYDVFFPPISASEAEALFSCAPPYDRTPPEYIW
ncbi:Uncharacterised protein [Bacteroides heparinolyticus]|uniref:Replication initiation factor n=2 Tax=Prevotella heparinolytica TaxID=28113 RepID=A0A449I621_9BACE|nr:Uncharacterised protein [Bacteroides heparinolyticus]